MDITSRVEITIIKDERSYIFSLPMGAPYGQAFDACNEILIEIASMAKKAAESSKREVAKEE